jgi:eukaryotic-like serine/threonine-protein kinase
VIETIRAPARMATSQARRPSKGAMAKTRVSLVSSAILLALASVAAQQGPVFELALVDRAGTMTRLGKLPPGTFAPRLSPDGRRVVFDTGDGMVWLADLANIGAARRFGSGRFPIWSADGTRLAFTGPDGARLYWQAAEGTGAPELVNDTARAPETWTTNPALVTYITRKENDDYDLWAFSPTERVMRPLVGAPTSGEMGGRFSPDGKWLAYQSNDSGTFEVYVEAFPRTGVRTRVTSAGGECPIWSPDGREIFYDRDHTLYAVSVRTTPRIEVGPETALPIKGFMQNTGRRRQWDVTPDGKQFLIVLP